MKIIHENHEELKVSCNICEEVLSSPKTLATHTKSVHGKTKI